MRELHSPCADLDPRRMAVNLQFTINSKKLPHYQNWPKLVDDGLLHWSERGVNAAERFFAEFKRVAAVQKKYNDNTAGGLIGSLAEILDAIRRPSKGRPRENVASMKGGEALPYYVSDLRYLNSVTGVPSDKLKQIAQDLDEKKITPEEAQEKRAAIQDNDKSAQDVDRQEFRNNGDEYFIEVKDNAHTARAKHSDGAQIDRLCAVVRARDRSQPLRAGKRMAALSLASGQGFQELFVTGVGQFYVDFGIHIFVEGEHYTPDNVRELWELAEHKEVRDKGEQLKGNKASRASNMVYADAAALPVKPSGD